MSKAKPTDTTGKLREQAIQSVIDTEAQRTADDLADKAAAILSLDDVVDATAPLQPTVIADEPISIGEPKEETVVIRVIDDIEAMTFGAGNLFSFKAGQKYEVPKLLAQHLLEKGYLANTL